LSLKKKKLFGILFEKDTLTANSFWSFAKQKHPEGCKQTIKHTSIDIPVGESFFKLVLYT